jgi:hypothetical protein
MKRALRTSAAILFGVLTLTGVHTSPAVARSYLGGTIYTRDGQMIEVVRFLEPLRKDDRVSGRDKDQVVSVPIGEALEINLLSAEVNYMYQHSKTVSQTGIVSLLLRNGQARLLTDAYFDRGTLVFTVLGDDHKQQERQLRFREIVKIRFDRTSGTIRSCPVDQAVFPDDYLFCPYHGVPLLWREP